MSGHSRYPLKRSQGNNCVYKTTQYYCKDYIDMLNIVDVSNNNTTGTSKA